MIELLHMVIDVAFFTIMVWLFGKRLDALEDWQDEFDEHLTGLELKKWDMTILWMIVNIVAVGDGDNP